MQINEKNYVDMAEEAITRLRRKTKEGKDMVSTSKIRNLLSMAAYIYIIRLLIAGRTSFRMN